MSAQTGEVVPEGPASQRLADRARFRLTLLRKNPNPIWIRELRQAARLTRTPFILLGVTVVIALIITAVGGSMMDSVPIDQVGMVLFQTFFSIAFFVVAWVGPALAANGIASEREGRTWEAVVLTGLRPEIVARGKFLAAYTSIGAYIVMLAPVGALPFLFGGIHPLEVVVGFIYLFVFAHLSVAFGLAVSSKFSSSRGAILVTLLLAVPISGIVFGLGGPALSFAVNELWPTVPRGAPIWLPTAYVRGDFGLNYVLLLFGAPALAIAIPAWFLYEATTANLTDPNDDRSSGLKRWLFVTAIVLAGTGAGVLTQSTTPRGVLNGGAAELTVFQLFVVFVVTMFMGEPLAASRRIQVRWDLERRGAISRFMGPGLFRTSALISVLAMVGTAIVVMAMRTRYATLKPSLGIGSLEALSWANWRFVAFSTAYLLFVIGLAAWLRARARSLVGARVLFLTILAGLTIVPGIVAAVVGVATRGDEALIIISVSPIYGFVLLSSTVAPIVELAGWIATPTFVGLGLLTLAAARRKAHAIIRDFDERVARADEMLAAEDAMYEEAMANSQHMAEHMAEAPPQSFAPEGDSAATEPKAPDAGAPDAVASDAGAPDAGTPDGEPPRES
ncbi:MAG: ABC transporter permease [Polyangiaceae bacterium]